MSNLEQLRISSRRNALISITGVTIFISSLLFASYNLSLKTKELKKVKTEFDIVNSNLNVAKKKVDSLKDDESQLNQYVINLINSTQNNQGSVNSQSNAIDWEKIKSTIVNLPSGKRKLALTIALLTTWKEIPFKLGENKPKSSFDSPGYLKYILDQVGISVKKNNNELLSEALMRSFKKVDAPLPGDLIFYKGQIGSFGLIYICPSDVLNHGFAIGTLQQLAR